MFRATTIFVLILLALAVGTLNLGGNDTLGRITGGTLADAQTTAGLLARTTIPGNDPYALAAALRLKSDAAIPHVARSTPLNRREGDKDVFNLARFKEKDNIQLTATVQLVTDHVYWYVQDGYDVNLDYLRESATNFETNIYPTNHKYFGSEWSPGVDGDPHITVLTAKIPGVGGYFSSADEYVKAINKYSNEREMIYIAAKPDGTRGPQHFYEGVLAHEFQHMIHWNVQRNRDIWVDEGSSETAMALNNYDLGGSDTSFRNRPDVQLNSWSDTPDPAHYGAAYLFTRYLMSRYGGADFLQALLASPGTGNEAMTAALARRGAGLTFDDAFRDWTLANYINDPSVGDGRYAYDAMSGRVNTDKRIIRYPATVTGDVRQYGTDYISLERGQGDTVIEFQGAPTAQLLPMQAHSGKRIWYSNRRDAADMTLTRAFDFRTLTKATLDYWTWYSIEGDFDYGYLEVSTDGGKTWSTEKTARTTDTNPNGANYGHGYSGPSGRDPKSAAAPLWVQEQADLSAYAGKQVLVRFEYITDESFNDPGWALDDLRVPELGYSSDAENDDGGWQAAGWVRIANLVPQSWAVTAIEYGTGAHQVTVQALTVDEQGKGRLTVPAFGSAIRQVVLVVSALAPTTTEKASYRVQAQRTR